MHPVRNNVVPLVSRIVQFIPRVSSGIDLARFLPADAWFHLAKPGINLPPVMPFMRFISLPLMWSLLFALFSGKDWRCAADCAVLERGTVAATARIAMTRDGFCRFSRSKLCFSGEVFPVEFFMFLEPSSQRVFCIMNGSSLALPIQMQIVN